MPNDQLIYVLSALGIDLAVANILAIILIIVTLVLSHKREGTRKTTPTPFLPRESNNSGSYHD